MVAAEEIDIRTPVRVSLVKDDLVAGCERIPVVTIVAFEIVCIVTLHQPLTIVLGIVVNLLAFPVLRFLAKRDPQFTGVMLRQSHYQSEYPAEASVARRAPLPRSCM